MTKKTCLLLPLLVVAALTLSFAAQTADETGATAMLDLLEPGQTVRVEQSTCGYRIRVYDPAQVDRAIEAIKSSRDQSGKPPGMQRTARESFEISHPVVKAVTADHVTLMHGNGFERHIASRAIVEISGLPPLLDRARPKEIRVDVREGFDGLFNDTRQ